ncbi:MAG: thiol-disulfide oxidoreductase DCC family protein [Bacteroidia bacterium]|nr:thiol-disulfide oxidoreductase DCC family protein [Bacteroidia bacterium]
MDKKNHVVIFDGVCNLCNASVDFIIRHDPEGVFSFTANQDPPGQRILADNARAVTDPDTVMLYEAGVLYDRSTAALRIARHLRFPLNLLYAGIIIPRPIRDAVYRWIARNRYRWFGKKETCRIPTPAERSRFLME